MDWRYVAFTVVLAAEIFLLVALLVSIRRPRRRIWPPPGQRTWQFWTVWIATAAAFLGSVALAFLDHDTFLFDHLAWKWIGGTLIVVGTALADWGVRTLTSRTSRGLVGEFHWRGPYRWTRNPQYLGHIAVVLGVMLAFDSALVVVTGLLGIACLLLTPIAEEPWLAERYGEEYQEYLRTVPRFLGRRGRR
ncbi:MAG: methyltransferase family protein [Gemmatimonadota bacterium]